MSAAFDLVIVNFNFNFNGASDTLAALSGAGLKLSDPEWCLISNPTSTDRR